MHFVKKQHGRERNGFMSKQRHFAASHEVGEMALDEENIGVDVKQGIR